MRPVAGREEYMALRRTKENTDTLAAARMGNKLAKSRLVQMNYSCYPNKDGKLKGAKMPSGTVGMDVDLDPETEGYDNIMESLAMKIIEQKDKLQLLMLEKSVSKGYHLVFRRQAGKSQVENLKWASTIIGCKYDEGAKDITRVFYTTGGDDLLYLDDALFDDNTFEMPEVDDAQATDIMVEKEKKTDEVSSDEEEAAIVDGELHEVLLQVLPQACFNDKYNGHSIADIIESFLSLYNDGHAPQKGNRNSMTFELAKALRCIVDYKVDNLKKYIPRFAGFDATEWEITLTNANNEPRKGVDFRLRKVLQNLEEIKPKEVEEKESLKSELPPALPEKLPHPLNVLSSKVPDYYKPAVCEGVFPALAAHLHGVKFLYWDNVEHEATFMSVLVAPMSTGKGCIRKPISIILDDLKKRDDLNRIRESEWKLANQGKIKKATPRPDDICIQVLIDNLTDAVFNQRVIDAHRNGERYLYTQCDELDTLKQLTSKGTAEQVSILIRKAFDNSSHGQERVGTESITGIAPLRFNFNASTTIPNCRRFFYRGVNDGTITRLSLSTIVRPVGAPRPVFGEYDDDYKAVVAKCNQLLESRFGTIKSPRANKFIYELLDENEKLADLYGSEGYLVLSYRATVIAWLKGMVLWILNRQKWNKDIENYVRWSLRYDLWNKMRVFGYQLESEIEKEEEKVNMVRTDNLLNQLPDTFTLAEMKALRKPNGSPLKDPRNLLSKWVERGYVELNQKTGIIKKKTEK